jgi:hypothetical protein
MRALVHWLRGRLCFRVPEPHWPVDEGDAEGEGGPKSGWQKTRFSDVKNSKPGRTWPLVLPVYLFPCCGSEWISKAQPAKK